MISFSIAGMLLFRYCSDVEIIVSCSSIGFSDILAASDMSFASVVCSCPIDLVTSIMVNIWDWYLVMVLVGTSISSD
jgi:hypothetical protein